MRPWDNVGKPRVQHNNALVHPAGHPFLLSMCSTWPRLYYNPMLAADWRPHTRVVKMCASTKDRTKHNIVDTAIIAKPKSNEGVSRA